ncbi:hypothetical protein M2152_002005 [Microbacteriaceae bacterium SG_E_30_P1]|uniref:Uncharacterized protein n=1 Tax=Antiquaquibacter oligotrophicus TaxID=2880260 RepID=A0ABT6KQQ9_9MICO|nr:hypothetical protein [Antiquaquibacter oligotrophicus]MDH6181823.1 hypothetical protein [Antiquaquibacter oligotrophicus]UDF12499.1 hypothetical protein LH407_10080 [Antiquaquibacter oligotrophicus]
MNAAAAKSDKTLAEQKAKVAEQHPDVQLAIDDEAPEQQPDVPSIERDGVPADGTCGATRYQQGALRTCELPIHHPGNHQQGDRGWRRSHGDGAAIAERPEDDAESEPTS